MASKNPYSNLPSSQFWLRTMADSSEVDFDPVVESAMDLDPTDAVATAGSCFAQHISRHLKGAGYNVLVTEPPGDDVAEYSARYGNIYTARQLNQLFDRADGTLTSDETWVRPDGKFVDPFRPQEYKEGFATPEEMAEARRAHLIAAQRVFRECKVFVFTLGLTEGWISESDGIVVPLAPGVVARPVNEQEYRFHNFTVDEVVADMRSFLTKLEAINPVCKIILTVSPVALKATYEPRHVLVSNTISKARLRVAADQLSAEFGNVLYFPSYEIITSYRGGISRYETDRRSVRIDGVAEVMALFDKHILKRQTPPSVKPNASAPLFSFEDSSTEMQAIICDEDALDPPSEAAQ